MRDTSGPGGQLLTRDSFRTAVLARSDGSCVVCGGVAVDAHHIIERRLWPDGGYYLDNGAALCAACHLRAESTEISCEELRERSGCRTLLPPHLYGDQRYDKWGNPIMPNGTRLRGELMGDTSVMKVMDPSVVFSQYVKYPRTYHLPWSPGVGKDDRVMDDIGHLEGGEIVVTEKMDGENTTMYRDHIHARSIDSGNHSSRDRVKSIWSTIAHEIPDGWRVCGENVYARHSIVYDDLPGYFLIFSVWDDRNVCLSWRDTVEWAELLGIPTVRVVLGPVSGSTSEWRVDDPQGKWGVREGYVVRRTDEFHYGEFNRKVGKWVRKDHVQIHGHWMRSEIIPNGVLTDS